MNTYQVDQDRLREAALRELEIKQEQKEEREAEEKAARDREAWQSELARLAQVDDQIVAQLAAAVPPRSEHCLELARQVFPLLTQLAKAAAELQATENAMQIDRWPGMDGTAHRDRVARLRGRAGLKPRGVIGLPPAFGDLNQERAMFFLKALILGTNGFMVDGRPVTINIGDGI